MYALMKENSAWKSILDSKLCVSKPILSCNKIIKTSSIYQEKKVHAIPTADIHKVY